MQYDTIYVKFTIILAPENIDCIYSYCFLLES